MRVLEVGLQKAPWGLGPGQVLCLLPLLLGNRFIKLWCFDLEGRGPRGEGQGSRGGLSSLLSCSQGCRSDGSPCMMRAWALAGHGQKLQVKATVPKFFTSLEGPSLWRSRTGSPRNTLHLPPIRFL